MSIGISFFFLQQQIPGAIKNEIFTRRVKSMHPFTNQNLLKKYKERICK